MPSPDFPISALTPDPRNANKGTQRGLGMVERSLQQYGAGRSILASADGVILAGNKTHDRAVELGIPIQEIESDGKTLFVIKRTDLPYDDPRAKELAIADNRASETGLDWDAEVLQSFMDDGVDLDQFWFPEELAYVLDHSDEPPSLDDLAAEHGDSGEEVFWDTLTIKLAPETMETYQSLMRSAPGDTDNDRFLALLRAVDSAVLGNE